MTFGKNKLPTILYFYCREPMGSSIRVQKKNVTPNVEFLDSPLTILTTYRAVCPERWLTGRSAWTSRPAHSRRLQRRAAGGWSAWCSPWASPLPACRLPRSCTRRSPASSSATAAYQNRIARRCVLCVSFLTLAFMAGLGGVRILVK